jgi:hypothetical protein
LYKDVAVTTQAQLGYYGPSKQSFVCFRRCNSNIKQ